MRSKIFSHRIARFCAAGIAGFLLAAQAPAQSVAAKADYVSEQSAWRERADQSLRRDTGWLTLAGRWQLKQGVNRIGTAKDNDIVFPAGVSPDYLGEVLIEGTKATLKLARGISMYPDLNNGGMPFETLEMQNDAEKMKWVHLNRLALTTFKHPAGKMILRIADQQSDVRTSFQGRMWYDVKPAMKLNARFIPAAAGKKQKIVNVLGEVTDEVVAGQVEFSVNGRTLKLDALGEPKDKELFIIFNDASAASDGSGTYPAGRFLVVPRPEAGKTATTVDFNRAYNPPCAFSAFTSCPLPPLQNQLKVKIEAGEKYRGG